jgi:hypothetical protein
MKKLSRRCEFKAVLHCQRASTGHAKVWPAVIYRLRQQQHMAMMRSTDFGLVTHLVIK